MYTIRRPGHIAIHAGTRSSTTASSARRGAGTSGGGGRQGIVLEDAAKSTSDTCLKRRIEIEARLAMFSRAELFCLIVAEI